MNVELGILRCCYVVCASLDYFHVLFYRNIQTRALHMTPSSAVRFISCACTTRFLRCGLVDSAIACHASLNASSTGVCH